MGLVSLATWPLLESLAKCAMGHCVFPQCGAHDGHPSIASSSLASTSLILAIRSLRLTFSGMCLRFLACCHCPTCGLTVWAPSRGAHWQSKCSLCQKFCLLYSKNMRSHSAVLRLSSQSMTPLCRDVSLMPCTTQGLLPCANGRLARNSCRAGAPVRRQGRGRMYAAATRTWGN